MIPTIISFINRAVERLSTISASCLTDPLRLISLVHESRLSSRKLPRVDRCYEVPVYNDKVGVVVSRVSAII